MNSIVNALESSSKHDFQTVNVGLYHHVPKKQLFNGWKKGGILIGCKPSPKYPPKLPCDIGGAMNRARNGVFSY